ncbi:hypothetical protein Tco_0949558, partial [Tanacetum coccineum]
SCFLLDSGAGSTGAMHGVISGIVVMIVVASVLIGGALTYEEGLGDEILITGVVTGGANVLV